MANTLLSRAGALDRRVTIIRPGPATTDQWGEAIAGTPARTTRWASVKPAPGTERFQSGEAAASATWRFIFRWSNDLVRVTDTLETDDGRTWDVKSADPIGLREGWDVLATARME